jgi:hypothetical protein
MPETIFYAKPPVANLRQNYQNPDRNQLKQDQFWDVASTDQSQLYEITNLELICTQIIFQ